MGSAGVKRFTASNDVEAAAAIADSIRLLRHLLPFLFLVLLCAAGFQKVMQLQIITTSRGIAFIVPEITAGLRKAKSTNCWSSR